MDIVKQGGQQASRGFTLIEMSIVLVIIGLIVGGILKGQEIVNSAREKSLVNQLNAVRAATGTYQDRHNAIPGDDPNGAAVSAGVAGGNGDGIIGTAVTGATAMKASVVKTGMNVSSNGNESVAYFAELAAEGLLANASPISAATTPASFGVASSSPLPSTAFSGSGLGIISGSHAGNTNNTAVTATSNVNWLAVWSFGSATNGGVSPRVAGHIDTAIDDGNPDTGNVRGDDTPANCNSPNAANYTATGGNDNITCGLLIRLE